MVAQVTEFKILTCSFYLFYFIGKDSLQDLGELAGFLVIACESFFFFLVMP